jgi:LacI family transcriptional regulator
MIINNHQGGLGMKNRHRELIKLLEQNKLMKIDELCDKLEVSPATIRRDLTELHQVGVRRVGGRAYLEGQGISHNNKVTDAPYTSKQIGCILSVSHARHNPYFSLILQGIEKGIAENGFSPAFIHTLDDIQNELVLDKIIHQQKIDGLIVVEGMKPEIYEQIKGAVPVIVGVDISDPTVPVITYDRINAAKSAVRHLLKQGHKKIGFIGGPGLTGNLDREKRFRGYVDALQESGIEINYRWVINADWDVDTSYKRMRELLDEEKSLPTAMFAASDMMAISAMRAVAERNMKIPEDMAFIGLDNIEIAPYTTPPLSSVHIPKFEMGQVAAKVMADYLRSSYSLPIKILLPYEVIVRESSINHFSKTIH